MTILITGGTGKTGLVLARLLHTVSKRFLVTSRSGIAPAPFKAVRFDWLDQTTFENPFHADSDIDRVYLIGPPIFDMLPPVKVFIDLAISKGVKRFVLLSGSQGEPGGPNTCKVHQYLLDIEVDYAVLRPTWFMQNFGTDLRSEIKEHDHVLSIVQDGRIPFVSTEDIAKAAFEALDAKESPNSDVLLVGPKLYSFDDVANILSKTLGRKITHKRISEDESKSILIQWAGLEHTYADYLVEIQKNTALGKEEEAFNAPEDRKIVGSHTLEDYITDNKELWVQE